MKNQLLNNIVYSGDVTIKLRSGNNIVPYPLKNAGCKALWNAIAKALAGYNIDNELPRYLDMVRADENENSLMVAPVPFTGVVWGTDVEESDTSTSAVYTATVTAAEKAFDVGGSQSCKLLMLNSLGEVLAVVEHESLSTAWSILGPGIDIIFEWKLTFSNKIKEVS